MFLQHHGVLGQKWGVRRYQNFDGSRTTAGKMRRKGAKRKRSLVKEQLGLDIPEYKFARSDKDASKEVNLSKGEKVYHVTPKNFKNINPGQDLFVSATDYDRNLYKSMLTMQMRRKGFGKDTPISEVEFTLKQDLKSPSNNQQKKLFNEIYSQNKDIFDQDMANYYKNGNDNSANTYDKFIKTLDKNGESKAIFYNHLKKNGYNAVLDQHDVDNSWMNASRPLIVIDAINTFGDFKVSTISDSDIVESIKKLKLI